MTTRLVFERVRRGLARVDGVMVASAMPAAVEGRPDDYRLAPSRLIEESALRSHPLGPPVLCPDPLAFLDGTQRYEVVGDLEAAPVVAARIAAAVRLRTGGRFTTMERVERRILVARPEVLEAIGDAVTGFDPVPVDGAADIHPLKALEHAHRAVDSARAAVERRVGAQFRQRHAAWLVVDGVISDAEVWATDARTIGVSKSHATLPFGGADLARYLSLPHGHRTSVFEPTTWRFTPPYSWGLRLWPFERRDLLHGLVRVEVAAVAGSVDRADEISRWLMAERVPLARPDPRWDRLLYGVATVERHLRAR